MTPAPTRALGALRAALRSGATTPRDLAAEAHRRALAAPAGTFTSVVDPLVLDRAAAALGDVPRGPLWGVPFVVKDNMDVAGEVTTAGCPAYGYRPERSAFAVARLQAAGALLVAKAALDQFATGLVGSRSPWGACASAWDAERISGGSSSGSALAVALGVVPFSLGTDTAGSGRVPAAFNGLVGLKPTRGVVGTSGVVDACKSLDCVSVFAADAQDAGLVLDVLAARDPDDPYARTRRPGPEPAGRLRVGVPRGALALGDPAAQAAWERALDRAPDLGDVVAVDVGPLLAAGELLYGGPWVAERRLAFGRFLAEHPDEVDPVVARVVLGAPEASAEELFAAQHRLAALAREAEAVWEAADVLLLPTAPTHPTLAEVAADPVGVNARLGAYTTFVNLLDLCAVAVPADPRADGLPFGVTLVAPAFADRLLVEQAARWQAAGAAATIELALVGAHQRGMALEGELTAVGAQFVRRDRTGEGYRLYLLPGGPPARPGLVRGDGPGGIDLEVWRLPVAALGRLIAGVPSPLAIGTIVLAGEREVRGFLCEAHAVAEAEDITAHGGWRRYQQAATAPV